ncbi:hypothetical protein OG949_41225 (plasmid) [Streptomyces scopuliridis]|uniref:DUF6197 family protein n=1 Tax=Streptomyces scopuliridis TaxID=452529 RepID=UPI002DDBEFA6|nr:hypothetical protein [Streptomyces scopuliridis]WSB39165.1 hypothetical protein OG949_41225 [Streptomyces scopuliridis]
MNEKNLPDRMACDFAHDVEVYVAGMSPPPVGDPMRTVPLLVEEAHELALIRHGKGWLAWGSSGMPLTGEQIAGHVETAAQVLHSDGWNPSDTAQRGIRDALVSAEILDPRRFTEDTRWVIEHILNLLIRASTGAPSAFYETWDMHPDRTVEEVYTILAAAAAYARRYGTVDAGRCA